MQQVLGYSPMKDGYRVSAVAGTAIFTSAHRGAAGDAHRCQPVLVVGMTSLTPDSCTSRSVGRRSYLADLLRASC